MATERDHVPPACLFATPLPSDLITVPSCTRCNRAFGLDDVYFRDALAISSTDSSYPPEVKSLQRAMGRSLKRRQFRPPAAEMLRRAREVWMPLSSPITERAKLIPLDERRLARAVERIVVGLHFHETGRILPKTHKPFVLHSSILKSVRPDHASSFHEIFGPLTSADWRAIGGKAFGYAFLPTTDDPDGSAWAMSFWGRVVFMSVVCSDDSHDCSSTMSDAGKRRKRAGTL